MKAFDIIKMMIINMLNFILYYLYMYLLGNSDYFFSCVFILLLVFLCTVIRNKSSCIYWIISYFLIIPYACIILQKKWGSLGTPALLFFTAIFFVVEGGVFLIVRTIKMHMNKQ